MTGKDVTRPGGAHGLPDMLRIARFRSPALSWALEQFAVPHPDIGAPKALDPGLKAEARRHLEHVEAACEPISREQFARWVGPILLASGNPPKDAGEATQLVDALYLGLYSYPWRAFTRNAQSFAIRGHTFRPTGGSLEAVVGDEARDLLTQRRLLREIVATPDKPATPEEPAEVVRFRRPLPKPTEQGMVPELSPEDLETLASRDRQLAILNAELERERRQEREEKA